MQSLRWKAGWWQGGLTKLLNVAGVPAQEGARGLVSSIHHCALDGSHSLPPSQHICTCNCFAQMLQVLISADHMLLCASPLGNTALMPCSGWGWACIAPEACITCMADAWLSVVHHASLPMHEGDADLAGLSCRCPKAPSAHHAFSVIITMSVPSAATRETDAHTLLCHAAIGCSAAEWMESIMVHALGKDPHQRGEVSWVN